MLIPLFLQNEFVGDAVEELDYGIVWEVLQALSEQDEDFAHLIQTLQIQWGAGKILNWSAFNEKVFVITHQTPLSLDLLKEAIATRCLEHLGSLWYFRYGQLCDFKQVSGHTNVPRRYSSNPKLAIWVSTQRKAYRQNKLDPEKITLLEGIGFVWKIK